jgi:hypothetical protein
MTPEQSRALESEIDKRYPEFVDKHRTHSLRGNDPWTGTITFYFPDYSLIAIVRFSMQGRNGGPQLMIERDWND